MQASIRLSRRSSIGAAILLAAAGWFAASAPAPALAAGAARDADAAFTHVSAPTRYIDVDGARLAYRRFGKPGGVPLLLCQHFVGTMDGWDPKVVDGLARGREVILFDNAGVAASGGTVPTTIEGMAGYAAGLLRALEIRQVDVLGFSMGSLVAQQLALAHPDTVRRVILVGSGPRAGVGMASLTPEFQEVLGKKHGNPDELLLEVFFTPSASSQAAGRAFVQRLHARTLDRDKDVDDKVAPAQVAAFSAWGRPQDDAYLKQIRQPVLVVSGSHDIVHYTVNSYDLQQKLPNAQLVVYPDSNHGSIYQYPDQFLAHATLFLDGVAASQR
jgi:pimeloyl-ACP methyl ester carboxylesterase